jgi:hypothetical protein
LGAITPWKTNIIEGESIKVGERELIPVVKVRSLLRREVTFGTETSSGGGGGLVWLKPIAMIERQPDGSEERVSITDEAGIAIGAMLVGAMVLPVLYLFAVCLMFLWRRRRAIG